MSNTLDDLPNTNRRVNRTAAQIEGSHLMGPKKDLHHPIGDGRTHGSADSDHPDSAASPIGLHDAGDGTWSILERFQFLGIGARARDVPTGWQGHPQRFMWPFVVVGGAPGVKACVARHQTRGRPAETPRREAELHHWLV